MQPHAPKLPPVTDEQLRLAFRQISRPGWPSTLEAALDSHVFRTCLYRIASNLNRRGIDRMPAAPSRQPALPFDEGLSP